MKKLLTTTTKKVPHGIIRGKVYNQANRLVMLIIKQGPTNYIKHVL